MTVDNATVAFLAAIALEAMAAAFAREPRALEKARRQLQKTWSRGTGRWNLTQEGGCRALALDEVLNQIRNFFEWLEDLRSVLWFLVGLGAVSAVAVLFMSTGDSRLAVEVVAILFFAGGSLVFLGVAFGYLLSLTFTRFR